MSTRNILRGAAFVLAASTAIPAVAQGPATNATIFAFTNPTWTWITTLEVATTAGTLSFGQVAFPPEPLICTVCKGGRGWYGHADGKHNWNTVANRPMVNLNYIASISGVRDYFVFDINLQGATVLGAHLHLQNPSGPPPGQPPTPQNPGPGYNNTGNYASALYRVWDITTPLDQVMSPNSGPVSPTNPVNGMDIYEDLGSGVMYGSKVVSAAYNGAFVDVALNADALSAISAFGGGAGRIGFGGTLTPVPEPETYALLLAGLGLLGLAAHRRARNVPAAV